MSTSLTKVKLIIPIVNGDPKSTLEHLKDCQKEITSMVRNGRMADEIIFQPKTNYLNEDNYLVYKEFLSQLQSQANLLPVLMIDRNVDMSVGLLAEFAEVVVIDDKKGFVSLFSEHANSEIGEDLKKSRLFSGIQRSQPISGLEIQENKEFKAMVDVMSPDVYLKFAEQFGMYEVLNIPDKASLTKLGKVLDFNSKREEKKKDEGIQLA
jgi:hypothetical protein